MFLKKIKLENIRSIKKLELSFELPLDVAKKGFNRQWTLILGENGAGKSSLLRAVALVTAGSEALKELLPQPDIWIRNGEASCSIEADFITAKGEPRKALLRWQRGQQFKDIYSSNKESLDDLDSALEHTTRSYFTVGYGASRRLSSARFSSNVPEIFHQDRARSVATLFSFDAALNPLENWAMDLHYREGEKGLKVIKETLDQLLPSVQFARVDKENRCLMFETQDGELPLNQLSDGYQSMAGWCGDLLYRITETYKDYDKPLETRGVLLVDELDLHLHPVWQRSLKEFLVGKLPNMQVIATTHSPLTAHEAGENELYFLNRSETDRSAVLNPYEGAPNKLFAHQLLMSPAFGLSSINSKEVDDLRKTYEGLNKKKNLAPDEKKKLKAVSAELKDLPDWSRGTELEQKQFDVLSKIEAVLAEKA